MPMEAMLFWERNHSAYSRGEVAAQNQASRSRFSGRHSIDILARWLPEITTDPETAVTAGRRSVSLRGVIRELGPSGERAQRVTFGAAPLVHFKVSTTLILHRLLQPRYPLRSLSWIFRVDRAA